MGKQAKLKQQRRQEGFEKLHRERERAGLLKQGRFYDRLMSDSLLHNILLPAIVADVTNIFEYLRVNDGEIATGSGPIMPPYNPTFLEFRNHGMHESCGILVVWYDKEDEPAWDSFERIAGAYTTSESGAFTSGVLFLIALERHEDFVAHAGFLVDDIGKIVAGHQVWKPEFVDEIGNERAESFTEFLTHVGIQALTFLNCRNVELVDHAPEPTLSERYEREFGVPMTTYKTLRIKPVRKQYESADNESESAKAHKRLHIVRGHIATYTDDAPLFGKYVGQYWIPAHVRGDEQRGMVVKDYEVEAPQQN